MGVRFLESYLERESRKACYEVYIPHLINEYRQRTNNSVPVIVIDGMSCLTPLNGSLSWLNGGQFKELHHTIEKFIKRFSDLGCKLVVYFDGPVQNIKLPVWKKRRLQTADDLSVIFDQLNTGTLQLESNARSVCLPNGIGSLFLYLLSQHDNCIITKSLRECDEEIARYAFDNKCFAILAQDTDFVIYEGGMYYLSIKHLNIDKMTTICYDRFNLALELGLRVDSLPLLASLLGNDIIEYESVKGFHFKLRRNSRLKSNIPLVAEFIRNLRFFDLSTISGFVFGTKEKTELLRLSIQSYDLSRAPSEVSDDFLANSDDNWNKILHLAKQKYLNSHFTGPLYDIMVRNSVNSSTSLEDYRPQNIIAPIGELLKDLRRYTYGILLHEMPTSEGKTVVVKELVMTGFDSMEDFVDVQPIYLKNVAHPGLLKLWTPNDKLIDDVRWEIIGEIFSLDPADVNHLPPILLIPTLAVRYFISQYSGAADWEINAFVTCSVCIQNYHVNDLAKLPADPLTYRSIWLYTALTRTCSTVNNLLFYIGDPIAFKYTLPSQYTDGKLFHEKYRQSSKGATVESLCEYQVENIEHFNLIKSIISR